MLQLRKDRGWLCSECVEMQPAKSKRSSAIAVGQQAEVADLDESRGQHVKQEAADELDRIEGHDLDAVVVFRVPPAEAHLAIG